MIKRKFKEKSASHGEKMIEVKVRFWQMILLRYPGKYCLNMRGLVVS